MKLTQKIVDRIQPPMGKADAIVFDDDVPGLGIRFQGKTPRWIVQYRVAGRNRRVTLGPVAGIELKDARKEAGKIIAGAKDGTDRQAEREQARARAGQTLGALLERYIEQHAKKSQRPKTLAETERYLRHAWKPLHGIPLATLTRADIAGQAQDLTARAPIAGKRALAHFKGALAWATRQGLIEANPAMSVEVGGKEVSRERVLSPGELADIWRAVDPTGDYGRIVRLLMLTGQRREEVGGMGWSELDIEKALWAIPAARAKNGRAHEVPLSKQALALLAEVPRREKRDLLFGQGKGSFSGWSKSKERLDERLARSRATAAGIEKPTAEELAEHALPSWHLHDIRRSVVTHMVEIGVAPHVVEAAVNHVSGHRGGVAGVYNRADYRRQKAAALQRWADWLERMIDDRIGDRTTTMVRAR